MCMKTTSILYILINLSGLFLASSVFAQITSAVEKGQHVLAEQDGRLRYGEVKTEMQSSQGDLKYTVAFSGYNKRKVRTSKVEVFKTNQMVLPVKDMTHDLQGKTRTLKKGSVILSSGKKIYVVEEVFQNGQLAVTPLVANLNSRNRVSENFARVQRANIEVLKKEDVLAVEVKSFAGYKKGARYKQIHGLPICDAKALQSYQLPLEMRAKEPVRFNCGRGHVGALVHAVFSDGTLAIDNHIFNFFPKSRDKYINPVEPQQEAQSQQ